MFLKNLNEASDTYYYGCNFTLRAPVLDLDKAQDYLDEDFKLMLVIFNDDLKADDDPIVNWRWFLTTDEMGVFVYETNRRLTNKEIHNLEEATEGQASDGLGEGFCQQEWSEYEDSNYDSFWDGDEPEWFLAEIDWYNGFKFKELGSYYSKYLK